MRTNYKLQLKWLTICLAILPAFAFGQATSMSGKKGAVVLSSGNHQSGETISKNPLKVASEAEWIHYDDTEMSDSWGFLISGEEYDIVAKWDTADITDYDEWQITKIKFIVTSSDPILKIKVWEGPNTTEIYSQNVPTYNVNSWTEVELDTPVSIDASQELWVGYYVDMTDTFGGFVTATDDGPPEDEYGNLCRWNGSWYSDFDNHNLRVYIEPVLASDFYADEDTICSGGTVNFTNTATGEDTYLWTFEGGTPATSTDENPSVVYSTPGFYDVTLEVSDGDNTETEVKIDYISVLETPAKADMPDGETGTCTGQFYFYEIPEVLYANDYEWELSPADAGELIGDDNTANFEADETWTGDFTITVRAINMCGDGDWSDELECTLSISPEIYTLEGGGSYCLDGDGVEITLSDSQEGIDYELFLGAESTGIIIAGTGSEISFGLLTEEGYYEAEGSNDNCSVTMSTQIQVSIDYPPLEPETPEGPTVVCDEATSDYTTSAQDDADSFIWILSPEEAGTISGDGVEATVEWSEEFTGMAYVSVSGVNDCGDGNPSTELEVSVGAASPEIEGEDFVCDYDVEDYTVEEHDGSTYTWEVTGGTITAGQDSYMITVEWGEVGTGYITVSEETANGCTGDSEEFEVTIDECTGVGEQGLENSISIYPNPVTGDMIHIDRLDEATDYTIQILNAEGRLVMQVKDKGQKQSMNVGELSTGLYIVKVIQADQIMHVSKFIKR